MLSNAYFLAKFRFDTAENEPAKNLQNFRKMHFRKMHFRKMHFRKMYRPGSAGGSWLRLGAAPRSIWRLVPMKGLNYGYRVIEVLAADFQARICVLPF